MTARLKPCPDEESAGAQRHHFNRSRRFRPPRTTTSAKGPPSLPRPPWRRGLRASPRRLPSHLCYRNKARSRRPIRAACVSRRAPENFTCSGAARESFTRVARGRGRNNRETSRASSLASAATRPPSSARAPRESSEMRWYPGGGRNHEGPRSVEFTRVECRLKCVKLPDAVVYVQFARLRRGALLWKPPVIAWRSFPMQGACHEGTAARKRGERRTILFAKLGGQRVLSPPQPSTLTFRNF